MAFIIKNQQNNWSYVLILVFITMVAGTCILFYANETIKEINSLSSVDSLQ